MKDAPRILWKLLLGFLCIVSIESSGYCQGPLDPTLNLLVNGDFKKGTEGWDLHAWAGQGQTAVAQPGQALVDQLKPTGAPGQPAPDPAETHDGKPSIRLENISYDDAALWQKVKVKPATRYRLSGWVKTKNVEWKEKNAKEFNQKRGASLCIQGGFEKSESIGHAKGWTHLTYDFASGTRSELVIGARLGFYSSPVKGTAWFSDISLVEVGH